MKTLGLFLLFIISVVQTSCNLNESDSERIQSRYDKINNLFETSGKHVRNKDYAKSNALLNSIIQECDVNKLRDQRYIFHAYHYLGENHLALGNRNDALKYALEAYRLQKVTKDSTLLFNSTHMVGQLFDMLDNATKAIEFFDKARKFIKQSDSSQYSTVTNNIAEIKFDQGMYQEALIEYVEARDYAEKYLKRYMIHNIGRTYTQLGKYDSAHINLLQALELDREIKDIEGQIYDLVELGRLFSIKNKYDSSNKFLLEANQLSRANRNIDLQLDIARILIDNYVKNNEHHKALAASKEINKALDSIRINYNSTNVAEVFSEYQKKIREDEQRREREREEKLQYSLILIGLVVLLIIIFAFSKTQLSSRVLKGLSLLVLLILFEFLLVLIDPKVEVISKGLPLIKLGFNLVLAITLIPIHNMSQKLISRIFPDHN